MSDRISTTNDSDAIIASINRAWAIVREAAPRGAAFDPAVETIGCLVASLRPTVRTAEDERRDVLAFLAAEADTLERHEGGIGRATALIILHARSLIERGDHVGAAEREAVKP